MLKHALLHALKHSVKLFPFLFLIYLVLEAVEHSKRVQAWNKKIAEGQLAPLIAGGVGLIPECGFSVMAAGLYGKGVIALGTLFTVFLVTSDEGIPVLLASPQTAKVVLPVMAIKFVYGVGVGFLLNYLFRHRERAVTEEEKEHEFHEHHCVEQSDWKVYFLNPLLRALKILAFIFVVSFVMEILTDWIGEGRLIAFLGQRKFLQLFVAPVVGMIPGCGSSIVIATAYQDGILNFAAMVAGLAVNSGIGLLVLFRQNKNLKENVFILLALYGLSVILGMVLLPFSL